MDYTRDFQTAIQTFILTDLPDSTPPEASFFLTTGLERWRAGLPELHFEDRTLRRAYPLGTHLSFKVSRGSPGSEEGDVWGQRRPERCHVVVGEATHVLSVESWMDFPLSARPSSLSARIERLRVYSPELDDTFSVLVWLPPQAGEGGRRFPAVYLHDGQNIFDRATSFTGRTWRADEAALNLAEAGLPCILVAVEVRSSHRAEDYCTFTLTADHFRSSAAAYQTFLAETLKPLVDARVVAVLA